MLGGPALRVLAGLAVGAALLSILFATRGLPTLPGPVDAREASPGRADARAQVQEGRRPSTVPARQAEPEGGTPRSGGVPFPVLLGLAGGGACLIAVLGVRLRERWARSVARYRVSVPRNDRADPESVRALIESWHRTLQEQAGVRRLLRGQAHMALELHVIPDERQATKEVAFAVVCPPELARAFDARLSACYPNARLGYDFAPPPLAWDRAVSWSGAMLRLRKGRGRLYRALSQEERSLVEEVLSVGQECAGAVGVQLRLSPASGMAEWRARRRVRTREADLEHRRRAPSGWSWS